jgi:hypothetical protein
MKGVHPFICTPVQLHTHKPALSFSCTPVPIFPNTSCQNFTDWLHWRQSEISRNSFLRKGQKAKAFSFSIKKKSLPILLLYPISILSRKVKHNGSIHKYTQLVMLTHYSPLRGWLPSVTLGHNHNQTTTVQNTWIQWYKYRTRALESESAESSETGDFDPVTDEIRGQGLRKLNTS